MKPINGALFYFFTVVFIPGLKAEDIEFAKKIAKKNRDTIDLINSYSCESRIIVSKENGEAHPEQKLFRSGSYWKNKDSFRFRYENAALGRVGTASRHSASIFGWQVAAPGGRWREIHSQVSGLGHRDSGSGLQVQNQVPGPKPATRHLKRASLPHTRYSILHTLIAI